EQNENVARLELEADGGVFGLGNEADRIRTFGENVFGDAIADQEWRRMTGVDVLKMALIVEDAEKHCGVPADLGVVAEKPVDVIEDARGVGAERHSGERTLEKVGAECGTQSFTGNVREQERGASVAEGEDVEIISTDGQAREVDSAD